MWHAWGCQIRKAGSRPEAKGRLHWLDVEPALLSADGQALNPSLQFDGTHMAPPYVQYMCAALNKLPQG